MNWGCPRRRYRVVRRTFFTSDVVHDQGNMPRKLRKSHDTGLEHVVSELFPSSDFVLDDRKLATLATAPRCRLTRMLYVAATIAHKFLQHFELAYDKINYGYGFIGRCSNMFQPGFYCVLGV